MPKSSTVGWVVAFGIIVLLVFGALYGNVKFTMPGQQAQAPACGAGTHLDTASGQCVPDSTGGVPVVPGAKQIYVGPVDWLVATLDGDTKAGITLTSEVTWAMHRDGSQIGVPAQTSGAATSTSLLMNAQDAGHMILCMLYKTGTVGFVDPAKTLAKNPTYMKEGFYLKDVDADGKLDQCYPIDVTGDPNFQVTPGAGPPQQNPDLIIDLIAWTSDASVTITNISSPTGMNTAGDYHATGYIAAISSTNAMNVVRMYANVVQSGTGAVNSTSGGLWSKLQAGTTYFMGFKLEGTGGQGGYYGTDGFILSNAFSAAYNSGDQTVNFWRGHDPNDPSKVDITQANYGMLFVQERLSGTTWLQYDIWVHTSGDLTASSLYYLYFKIDAINPAGTTTTNSLTITLTG